MSHKCPTELSMFIGPNYIYVQCNCTIGSCKHVNTIRIRLGSPLHDMKLKVHHPSSKKLCKLTLPPLQLTWCARQMRSKSCLFKNLVTMSEPKVKETPRSLSPQPCMSLSGSDQRRSQRRPVSGTSVGLAIERIWSKSWRSGDNPAGRGGKEGEEEEEGEGGEEGGRRKE